MQWYYWQSPFSDFGYPEKYKIIKDIYLKSDDAVTITIRTEKLSKSYTLNPKDGVVHLRTLVKGKHIAIDFESNSDSVKISTPTVIMGLVWSILVKLLMIDSTHFNKIRG